MTGYDVFLVAICLERLAELVVSSRHAAAMRARGGVEYGAGHYPFMVALHVAMLAGCFLEPVVADRPFIPALGWSMVVVVLAAMALRWWCIATLGVQWNTRVIVAPGLPLVTGGPYRWLRHPNYVAVVAEGAALPLVHSAWVTALVFTVLNAVLLRIRIRVEDAALATAASPGAAVRA
jgi:methyltransferase